MLPDVSTGAREEQASEDARDTKDHAADPRSAGVEDGPRFQSPHQRHASDAARFPQPPRAEFSFLGAPWSPLASDFW